MRQVTQFVYYFASMLYWWSKW